MSHPIYQLAAEYVRVCLKGIGFDIHSCLHVFMPRVYDYCLQYLLYCLCVYAIRSMSYLSCVYLMYVLLLTTANLKLNTKTMNDVARSNYLGNALLDYSIITNVTTGTI